MSVSLFIYQSTNLSVSLYIYLYIYLVIHSISVTIQYKEISVSVGRVFANGPRDLGLIPGHVIPKTLKMVLDTSLLNTQQYKVCIKVKWSNPGKGVASPLHLSVVAIENRAFWSSSTTVAKL